MNKNNYTLLRNGTHFYSFTNSRSSADTASAVLRALLPNDQWTVVIDTPGWENRLFAFLNKWSATILGQIETHLNTKGKSYDALTFRFTIKPSKSSFRFDLIAHAPHEIPENPTNDMAITMFFWRRENKHTSHDIHAALTSFESIKESFVSLIEEGNVDFK